MVVGPHELKHEAEALEIISLRGAKRHGAEERNNPLLQIRPAADAPAEDILPMVVVPAVTVDRTAAKEGVEQLQRR
jgi:hypothetical protein